MVIHKYIINGEERKVRDFRLFGLTFVIYHKVKHADKRVKLVRDCFYGTGTTVFIYLPF